MLKKLFVILSLFMVCQSVYAASSDTVRNGIAQYKAKNYAGCICTMKNVIKNDPSNAMAHYYAAIAYARMGDKSEAINYYTKVISLNSNPTLTAYSKQGLATINNGFKYNTENATADNFIQGGYKTNVQPDVTKQIKLIELERRKDEINSMMKAPSAAPAPAATTTTTTTTTTRKEEKIPADDAKTDGAKKSMNYQPTDEEIANAVKTLAAVGLNPLQYAGANAQIVQNPQMIQQYSAASQAAQDLAQLQMMMGSQNNNSYGNSNNMMNFLPYLMQSGQNSQMSKEFLQTMMMSQMMPDFSFDTSKN